MITEYFCRSSPFPTFPAQMEKTVLPEILQGQCPKDRPSQLLWPHQASPSPQDWRIWLLYLRYLDRDGKLCQPLGKWIGQPQQQWQWYCTSTQDKIIKYDLASDAWTAFKPRNNNLS
jgi:hypothetical protein